MMSFIRSTIFRMFMLVWTIVITTAFAPFSLLRNEQKMAKLGLIWSRIMVKAIYYICDVKIEVIGNQYIPKEPSIFAARHESIIETFFLLQYLPNSVYILKQELLSIPFYGWFLKDMGMIPINRKGGMNSLKFLLKEVQKSLQKKHNIIIFPEGTRMNPGEFSSYHSGIAALYNKFPTIPIVPVATNSGVFWSKNSYHIKKGRVVIEFLPTIDKNLAKQEMLTNLKSIVDQKSKLLYEKC